MASRYSTVADYTNYALGYTGNKTMVDTNNHNGALTLSAPYQVYNIITSPLLTLNNNEFAGVDKGLGEDSLYTKKTAPNKYEVTGGKLDGKTDVYDEKGKVIAKTIDPQNGFDDNGNPKVGVKIDLSDTSGKEFMDKSKDAGLLYFATAFRNLPNDFKSNNMPSGLTSMDADIYRNRMMPIDNTIMLPFSSLVPIITPAEYIGNYTAGYISGNNGLSYSLTRWGFNLYQGNSGEPPISAAPQDLGWNAGNKNFTQTNKSSFGLDSATTAPSKSSVSGGVR